MSRFMRAIALVAIAFASAPAAAATPWWFSIGGNLSHVDNASVANCGGGQAALTVGARLMLRAQFSHISYEHHDSDGSNECDVGYWGDSDVKESALLVGVMARGGAYLALGPASADFGDRDSFDELDKPQGKDTGLRVEIGWSSRRQTYKPAGVEWFAFRTVNDIRNYTGAGINLTLGPRRPRVSARPRPAR